jgi:GH15 family glucan-1,4-alpha-glucosidase
MQAIEEWFRFPEFQDDSYKKFVFDDADAMLRNMYTEENSPYLDYPGGFFYDYGDHVYTDGARCEGLVAAYFLAERLGDKARAARYRDGCYRASQNLLYTVNTRQSAYAHRYPEKTAGSFRFKLTRQWVRVDSVQHTACFFARLAGDLG